MSVTLTADMNLFSAVVRTKKLYNESLLHFFLQQTGRVGFCSYHCYLWFVTLITQRQLQSSTLVKQSFQEIIVFLICETNSSNAELRAEK